MKMKTFSKIMAVALTAMMTVSLTSCEDESVPAYGTGVDGETEHSVRYNLSPTAPVETEPAAPVEAYIHNAYIGYSDEIGYYVSITVVGTNNTGEDKEAGYLFGMSVVDDANREMTFYSKNPMESDDVGISKLIPNGDQAFVIFTFGLESTETDFIDITVSSVYVDGVLDSQRFYLTEE